MPLWSFLFKAWDSTFREQEKKIHVGYSKIQCRLVREATGLYAGWGRGMIGKQVRRGKPRDQSEPDHEMDQEQREKRELSQEGDRRGTEQNGGKYPDEKPSGAPPSPEDAQGK